jgi:hypothetical protein
MSFLQLRTPSFRSRRRQVLVGVGIFPKRTIGGLGVELQVGSARGRAPPPPPGAPHPPPRGGGGAGGGAARNGRPRGEDAHPEAPGTHVRAAVDDRDLGVLALGGRADPETALRPVVVTPEPA